MQKRLTIFSIIGILILGFTPVLGQYPDTNSYSEKINKFAVDITINKNGSFLVYENIIYDFGLNYKHGIYRDIPIGNLAIRVLKVVDEAGLPYIFKTSRENNYLRIQIGDPSATINGEHAYNIFYNVQNGLRYFPDHDELYWNITGNEWDVPIQNAKAKVILSKEMADLPGEDIKFACFTGTLGSKASECQYSWLMDKEGEIVFSTIRNLNPHEGLTIVLGWPKGIVEQPFFAPLIIWFQNFWPILIPVLTFIFLFKEWWKKGKDPRLKKTIVAQYDPPDNLRPIEVKLIMDEKLEKDDIPALIIDLAVRGYIKIREIKKTSFLGKNEYMFIKMKDFRNPEEELNRYERDFLEDIFGEEDNVLISSLKNSFYSNINELIDKVCAVVTFSGGYFVSNPKEAKKKWAGIGSSILALVFVIVYIFLKLTPSSSSFSLLILFASVIASGILFIIFSQFMPKRTEKGTEAYWHALGFKEYINTAEKYRLQFQEKENIFEKYLPYAIVFGLAEKWAKAFEGIYNNPPSWYEGDFGPRFTTFLFVSSLNQGLANVNSVFTSRPGGGGSGFGGGGFSGGGGGGGGGGSW